MPNDKQNWKMLIANKKRRKILYLLKNMGVATKAQIQEEFRKRNEFPSWSTIHGHVEKLLENGLVTKTTFPPETKGGYYHNKKTGEKKYVEYKESLYKVFELTSDAKIWLEQLEGKMRND